MLAMAAAAASAAAAAAAAADADSLIVVRRMMIGARVLDVVAGASVVVDVLVDVVV